MDYSDQNLPEEWVKKRKLTKIAFIIQSMLMGCEYGIFIVNLWLYITEMVDTDHPRVHYCVISVAYLLSATISSVFISWLADKTREIQMTILFTNSMYIIGNIIYMIPFSPLLLLIGRIIAGIGQPGRSVMAGELVRSFPTDQVYSVFSTLGAAFALGFMIAPGLNVAFSATDVTWGGKLHVTYANVSGFYMSIFFLLLQMVHICMTSNLSKEYDLKQEQQRDKSNLVQSHDLPVDENDSLFEADRYILRKNDADKREEEREKTVGAGVSIEKNNDSYEDREDEPLISSNENKEDAPIPLKQLLTNADTLLLLCLQFMESYVVLSMDLCLPMLTVSKLQWSLAAYNGIIIATSFFTLLPSIYLIFRTITDKTMFYIALPSLLAYALMQLVQMMWQMQLASREVNVFLAVVYCFTFIDLVLIREIFIGSFLARMVASRYQASVDSIRLLMSRMGAIVAMVSAPFALQKIEIVGSSVIGILFLFGILLISRRKTMTNLTLIIN